MAEIYIAFVDTPGFFAGIIRRVIKQKYIHVVVALDADLKEAYSVGRRNPAVPFFAGFEREDREKILNAFPTADYMICGIRCTDEQKEHLTERLRLDYSRRFHYHYTVAGLPFILAGKPFYRKNHFTCSSYLAKVLEEEGMMQFDKHFSLVTPKDFHEHQEKRVIFEGSLMELVYGSSIITYRSGAAYGQ